MYLKAAFTLEMTAGPNRTPRFGSVSNSFKRTSSNTLRYAVDCSYEIPLIKLSAKFHVDRKATQAVEAMGVPCVTYDGGADMWAKSLEDLMAVCEFSSS